MKYYHPIYLFLMLLLASACTESYYYMKPYAGQAQTYSPSNPWSQDDKLVLYPPGEEPADTTYRFISKLEVKGSGSYEVLLGKLKHEGHKVKADAILLDKRKWVLKDEYASPEAVLTGVAIKFPYSTEKLQTCIKSQEVYRRTDSAWQKVAVVHWGLDGHQEAVTHLTEAGKISMENYIKRYDLNHILWEKKAPWRYSFVQDYGEHNQKTQHMIRRTYFVGEKPLKTYRFYYRSPKAARPYKALTSYRVDVNSLTAVKEELKMTWRADGQLAYMDIFQKDNPMLRYLCHYDEAGKCMGSEYFWILENGFHVKLFKVENTFYTIDDIDGEIGQEVQYLPKDKW